MPTIHLPAGQSKTPPVSFLGSPALLPPDPSENLHRDPTKGSVHNPARKRSQAFKPTVRALGAVPDRSADQPPERIAAEGDRDQCQEDLPERLLGDRLERALLVGDLPAVTEGELDGEDADDSVDERPGHEPGPRKPLECG